MNSNTYAYRASAHPGGTDSTQPDHVTAALLDREDNNIPVWVDGRWRYTVHCPTGCRRSDRLVILLTSLLNCMLNSRPDQASSGSKAPPITEYNFLNVVHLVQCTLVFSGLLSGCLAFAPFFQVWSLSINISHSG